MSKKVSWMWGGKKHYGTLIRETKTHKFARTKNGKVKKIKKQWLGNLKKYQRLKKVYLRNMLKVLKTKRNQNLRYLGLESFINLVG